MLPALWRQGCALVLAAGIFTQTASAATIFFNPSATSVAPGSSFTVAISGSSVNTIGGYSLYLNSTATGSHIQLTGQSLNTSLFTYGGPSPSFPQTISTTSNSQDLGAFALSTQPANTTLLLGTATISLAPGIAPGTYSIGNTAGTVFTDGTFTLADFAPASSFSFTVVPEPTTYALLVAAAGMVLLANRTRLRPIPARRRPSGQ